MGFKDQVVLVTGAAKGIGRAIAAAFALEKALVIINDISAEESLAGMLQAPPFNNGCTRTIRADIGDSGDVKRMFEEIDSMPIRLLHNSPLASEVRDCVVARAFVQSLIGR